MSHRLPMTKMFISLLRVSRASLRISQSTLSKESGISRQTISALELGKTQPTFFVAYTLAEYFDCPIERLFTFKGPRKLKKDL